MTQRKLQLLGIAVTVLFPMAEPTQAVHDQAAAHADTVVVRSGSLELRALRYSPRGTGPFRAVLFLHGSGFSGPRAALSRRYPQILGPLFARHGYMFLHLYRRGDGLSAGQGIPSGDLMDPAGAEQGRARRNRIQMRLLEQDELRDALAGLALLRKMPGVDPHRISVVGHSFGGSLSLLLAEREPTLRAVVALPRVVTAGTALPSCGPDFLQQLEGRWFLCSSSRLRTTTLSAQSGFWVGSGRIAAGHGS